MGWFTSRTSGSATRRPAQHARRARIASATVVALAATGLGVAAATSRGSTVHEADLGSILGWGFPSYTGGTLSFIDTVGPARFVAECKRLRKRYGERFKPTRGLLARAQSGEGFYGKVNS